MSRRSKIPSFGGRDSHSGTSRSSVPDYGVRGTPLMRSSKKTLPSTSQKPYNRSSYFGSSDHHGMKDTRPLSDKGYMRRCVNEIIMLLGEMNYNPMPSVKSLMTPSNKDYFRIVEFLFSSIAKNYKMVGRQDEELLKLLKDLNYPYILSKSTLSNVGAMTALPAALGALHWLMEIVKYSLSVEENELTDMLYRNDKKQEYMFEYLSITYLAFMNGEDEPYTQINDEYSKRLVDLNKEQHEDLVALRQSARNLGKAKEDLLKVKEEMSIMDQRIPVMEEDKSHFKKYFEQIDEYCRSLENKTGTLKEKENELDAQIALLQSEVKEMHSTITGQELSVSDVEVLKREKIRIASSIKDIEEACKNIEEKCGEKQVEYSKIICKVDLQIADYSDVRKCSLLLPENESGGDSETVDYSLEPGRGEIEKNMEKLTVVIRPKLLNDKSSLILSQGNVMQQRNRNSEQIDQLKEQVTDQKLALKNLEEQLTNLKEDMDEQEKKYAGLEENDNRKLETIKEDIKRLKTVKSYTLDDIKAHLKKEEIEFKQLEEKMGAEEKEYRSVLVQMSSNCLDYKEKMASSFKIFTDEMKITEQEYVTQFEDVKSELLEVHRATVDVQKQISSMNE